MLDVSLKYAIIKYGMKNARKNKEMNFTKKIIL